MITITLFTRQDCHLCEQVKEDLLALQALYPHQLVEIDLDTDDGLREKYGVQIPVVQIGPYTRRAPITRQELMVSLGAATDRQRQLEKVGSPQYEARVKRGGTLSRSDRISFWLSNHYMVVLNLFVAIYLGLPFLAPVFMRYNLPGPARLIYRSYSLVCHQLSFRSWFMFGEQPVYPRARAGVEGYATYGQATGLSEANTNSDLLTARSFTGDERVGYKVAFCQRDVAIYGAILLFGLLFALTGRKLRALPWYLWILIGMGPIGLDGFSQLLSQPPFSLGLLPLRESTPLLRTLTGSLFGFTTAWFGFPEIEAAMRDTRRVLTVKFARLKIERQAKSPGTVS